MSIEKTALGSGPDLATRYGQKTQADETQAAVSSATLDSGSKAKAATGAAPAMVQLSPEALERAEQREQLAELKDHYAKLPETRAEVIAAVKEKLEAGFYDSAEAKAALADRMLDLARGWRAAKA